MRSNLAIALLCLLLGAALADWLSARDANAQALPPSSGGTSYTHPSAISLANGIESRDGGDFYGQTNFHTDGGYYAIRVPSTTSNGPAIELPNASVIKFGAGGTLTGGSGVLQWSNTIYANDMAALAGAFQSNAASGNTFVGASGGYSRTLKQGAGAPAGADCDAAGEAGREYYDTTNHLHYVCEGAAGWYKSGAYAP